MTALEYSKSLPSANVQLNTEQNDCSLKGGKGRAETPGAGVKHKRNRTLTWDFVAQDAFIQCDENIRVTVRQSI